MAGAAEQSREVQKRDIDELSGVHAPIHSAMEHILVCLDRSALSETCVPHAVALAKAFDARMTLLHVMQGPHSATPTPDPLGWEIARQEAQAYLDRLRDQTQALGPTTRTILAQGHPAARIVSVAAEVGADLTVLGSHGEAGPVDAMLGTTVQQVLTFSRGSVFVARPTPTAWITPKRILVPLDGSTRTECVLPTAARVARHHGAELVLVHVVSEPVPNAILAGENFDRARDLARRLEAGAERYLQQIASSLAHEGLSMRTVVLREADARQALLELCEREHVDLMVVSAHGATCNAARPFGTVASYLLSYARPALLVVQDLRETERQAVGDDVSEERHATPLRGTPQTGPEAM